MSKQLFVLENAKVKRKREAASTGSPLTQIAFYPYHKNRTRHDTKSILLLCASFLPEPQHFLGFTLFMNFLDQMNKTQVKVVGLENTH